MRGDDRQQQAMFSVLSPEQRVPQDHPLRTIRTVVDEVLRDLSRTFDAIYAQAGRPSIPPEQLLRALLLQVLYTVRSERLLMEELHYNLLFRWFVGLNMDEPVWDHSTFSKNRERFLAGDVAQAFFDRVLAHARQHDLLSDEHFTVDATLLEAWASLKSFRPKDEPAEPPPDDPGNPTVDFHGERRSNDTHQSTTDADARLYRKGKGREAKLCYMGHVVMENRHGLAVRVQATIATGDGGTRDGRRSGRAVGRGPRRAGRAPGGQPAPDRGGRQRVRHPGLRRRDARLACHPARRSEHDRPAQCDRRTDDSASRLRHQPAGPHAGGRDLRLAEDGRPDAQAAPSRHRPRGLGLGVHDRRVQLGPPRQHSDSRRDDGVSVMKDLSARDIVESLGKDKAVIDATDGCGGAPRTGSLSTSRSSSSPHVAACASPIPKLAFSSTCLGAGGPFAD